jgi:hypothetical protein
MNALYTSYISYTRAVLELPVKIYRLTQWSRLLGVGIIIPGKTREQLSKEWSDHYRGLRTEDNIMMVRRKAIWAGKDPNTAELNYRQAIRRKMQKKKD